MKDPKLLETMKNYKGRDDVPEDFDSFWNQAIAKMTELPEYKLEERDFSIPNVACYELTFKGTRNGLVYSRMILPKTDHKVPVIFHFHGYMGRCWDWSDMLAYTVAGYGVVSMDVSGQSGFSTAGDRSPLGNTVKGKALQEQRDVYASLSSLKKDELFYKDIYLDLYQLIEIVASLPQVNDSKLASYGASQGGALALVAAGLNPRIQRTVAIYPFLSDFRRVLEIGNTSEAYDELFRYFKFHDPFHETEDRLMQTLAYIDVKNFAHRIKGQVHMITGLDDDVCYPETQFAIYNRLECPKEHLIMPEYAHEAMNVQVNDLVYNWLCGSKIPKTPLELGFMQVEKEG